MYDSFVGVINFVAGLSIFIYGMHIMSDGLQQNANSRFKDILAAITKNKFFGVLTGVVVTALIQSSSSTTVMLVGFVNAGLMTLGQTVGVIMGANIGTTVTSWIVSLSSSFAFLKTSFLAPIALIIGVCMIFFGKKEKTKVTGQIIVGFGFLFFGLEFMSETVKPLRDSQVFIDAFATLGSNPILGILAGALVTAVIQSSSASVGILQVLALNGIVTWDAAVFIILGQNIGTCITAILSSIGASKNAKATAYMHLLFNLIGSIIFAIIAFIYFKVNPAAGNANIDTIQISIFHSVFNITNTIMLFPFADLIVKAAAKMAGVDDEDSQNVVTLDERLIETPEVAIVAVYNEIEKMATKARENMVNAITSITTPNSINLAKDVLVQERAVNELDANLTTYLIKLSHTPSVDDTLIVEINNLFHFISDIEQVSDYATEIAKQSISMNEEEVYFTSDGCAELNEILDLSLECFDNAIISVSTNDKDLAYTVKDQEREVDKLEAKFRDLHITRLTAGDCNFGTKAYYTDILSLIERVSDRASNIANCLIK